MDTTIAQGLKTVEKANNSFIEILDNPFVKYGFLIYEKFIIARKKFENVIFPEDLEPSFQIDYDDKYYFKSDYDISQLLHDSSKVTYSEKFDSFSIVHYADGKYRYLHDGSNVSFVIKEIFIGRKKSVIFCNFFGTQKIATFNENLEKIHDYFYDIVKS